MVKQYEVLQWASSFLRKHRREEKVAEILLQHHLKTTREHFFITMRNTIEKAVIDRFKQDIKCHALTGIPYQHLTGYEYFYGRQFIVNEHVLIPRQETEELVQYIVENNQHRTQPFIIVDVGTGSGVIAITLSLELPNAFIYATDISEEALMVAEKNAKHLEANVSYLHGDFLAPLIQKEGYPHIIVSNPPYINKIYKESLSDTVRHDPSIALFAENKGLRAYETILEQSTYLTSKLESIYFEIGFDQGDDIQNVIKATYKDSQIKLKADMNGKDRIVHVQVKR